ncbi:dual specificity protein kinase kns1, partial [Steccherinum ochraceum]
SRAAAAAQALSASTSSTTTAAPPSKKRKRDPVDVAGTAGKRPAVNGHLQPAVSVNKSWASGSAAATDDASKGPVPCDDKEGHYIIVPDDMIARRYRTVRLLGQGTFGKVVEALDTETNQRVAIKIIRAIPKYRDASKIEVRVLQKLKERDPTNRHKCIHLQHWFDHRNHICIVSELLGMCVYDFLKENEFAPFPRHHIQSFARQLLGSVAFLHDLHLIHTDLKPENILLVNNGYKYVNVPAGKRNAPTRLKKILDSTDIRLGWSYPCDAFSLGCILVEFFTGVALFQTHDNLEHLAMMEHVMDKMPERFARAGARTKPEFFKEGSKLDFPKNKITSRQSRKEVRATKSLIELIPQTDGINKQFYDLVKRLLTFDPAMRITVKDALAHPYFSLRIPEDPY